MLQDMCLITTYKNNFELMESFVNFYQDVWGINKFYFIIGITSKSTNEQFERIEYLNRQNKINIEYILYRIEDVTTLDVWSKYKQKHFFQLDNNIPHCYKRILNIDNDEFYYIKDKSIIEKNDELHFHFIEFIPHLKFNTNADFYWSLQGWFYRVNFFLLGNRIQKKMYFKSNELKSIESDMNRSEAAQITHQWCKLLKLKRENILTPWTHLDKGKICKELKSFKNVKDKVKFLKNNYFCYHIGVPDMNYLAHKKTRWINPKTKKIFMQAGDIFDNIELYFQKYYLKPIQDNMFKDNYLKRYLRNHIQNNQNF